MFGNNLMTHNVASAYSFKCQSHSPALVTPGEGKLGRENIKFSVLPPKSVPFPLHFQSYH